MSAVSKKRIAWVTAAAAAVAGGVWFLATRPASAAGPVKFETAKADRGPVTAKVTATGTLSALVTVQVGSQVSGRIAQLFVDFNSQVRKGQVLAKIDPQLFEAAAEQARANDLAAEANLRNAEVQVARARRNLARATSLAAGKLVAQQDLDNAQSDYDTAVAQLEASRASVEQARAALHQARVNLAYTTITSPIDGIVVSRSVDVGQTVAASLQAPTLFVLAEDLRKMQVDTSVAESDIGKLQPGMEATFTVDAWPGERFKGAVRQIRNAPQTVQNIVTYDAVIDVENPELKLKPGMTANATFVYAHKDDVVRVPNAALRFRPPAELLGAGRGRGGRAAAGAPGAGAQAGLRPAAPDQRVVWLLREGQPAPVRVTTGVSDGSVTEVAGEVHEGDLLVTDATGAAGARPPGPPRMF
jgi:HlyD family secretion protein